MATSQRRNHGGTRTGVNGFRERSANGYGALQYCIFAGLLFIFYMGFNTTFSWRFSERPGFLHYDMLGEAFLSGQLNLRYEVDARRAASGDPLNPSLQWPYLRDAIIWNGKYYFQHGPVPGAMHAAWMWATRRPCPTGLMVVFFGTANVMVIALILCRFKRLFFPNSPEWVLTFALGGFAFSGAQMYMVSRPVIYNEAVCIGMFFVLVGSAILLYWLTSPTVHYWLVAAAGLLFGAAVATRSILIGYPLSFAVCYLVWEIRRGGHSKACLLNLLGFIGPVVFFVAALLLYNCARFGSLAEFGSKYIAFPDTLQYMYLTRGGNFFRLEHIPYHIYHYLFSLPEIMTTWPYVRLPWIRPGHGDVQVIRELVCSVFLINPVLALIFLGGRTHRTEREDFALVVGFAIVACSVQFVALTLFVGATLRYFYDFVPLLFLVVFWGLCFVAESTGTSGFRRNLTFSALTLLFSANMLVGIYCGFVGSLQ